MVRTVEMRQVLLACLLALPAQAQAQETPGRMMLEAGITGGNSIACPGHYIGIEGQVVGPVSAYGMVEAYRCDVAPEPSSRLGASVRLGRAAWSVRPALRTGLEYNEDGDVSHTVGASLTFGRRYGARFIVDRWTVSGGRGPRALAGRRLRLVLNVVAAYGAGGEVAGHAEDLRSRRRHHRAVARVLVRPVSGTSGQSGLRQHRPRGGRRPDRALRLHGLHQEIARPGCGPSGAARSKRLSERP